MYISVCFARQSGLDVKKALQSIVISLSAGSHDSPRAAKNHSAIHLETRL